jgi:hypothetical protein
MPSARGLSPTTDVLVEVIRLGLTAAGQLGWSLSQQAAAAGEDPDRVARRLAGHGSPPALVHSTSWRWDPPGVVVLTYAAAGGEPVGQVDVLDDPVIVTSGDPLRPRPDGLHDHHVVAHAVWHVAVLAARDPVVAAVAADPEHRDLFAAMARAAGVMPTATFQQAHPGTATATGHPA